MRSECQRFGCVAMTIPVEDKMLLIGCLSGIELSKKLLAKHPEEGETRCYTRAFTMWHNRGKYQKQATDYLAAKSIEDRASAQIKAVEDRTVLVPTTIRNKCEKAPSAFDDAAIFVKIHNDMRELIEIQKETLDLFRKLQGEKK